MTPCRWASGSRRFERFRVKLVLDCLSLKTKVYPGTQRRSPAALYPQDIVSKAVGYSRGSHKILILLHCFVALTRWSASSFLVHYTGCNRRNVRDFGRVFLRSDYTDITQNTYIQSWTVTEITAGEVWNFDSCYSLIDYQIHIETGRNMWFL